MFALVDANNMYVSCERVFQPRLNGRPVVVLSSNDGACIARSNEAKALGVKMAQPWFQVKHLERSAGLVAVSANFELYSDMSSRMMTVMSRFAPEQEIYSIDESFLSMKEMTGSLTETGHRLRAAVLKETGLPTSVGFGKTKTLAKLANHVGKTADRKPGSFPAKLAQVCDFSSLSQDELDAVLAKVDVGDIWGVGRKLSPKLMAGGIKTALQLSRANPTQIRRQFSVVLEKTVLELKGVSCLELMDMHGAQKANQQILVSRSFAKPVNTQDGVIEAVTEFVSRAAERLRSQGSQAKALSIFFGTSAFRTHEAQHQAGLTIPLIKPTADSRVLAQVAVAAVKQQFRPGFNYAKAGAILLNLSQASTEQGQLDFFGAEAGGPAVPGDSGSGSGSTANSTANVRDVVLAAARPGPPNREKLMATMDSLNKKFGRDSVHLGSTSVASNQEETKVWATKQERRSPRYTTRWDEIPTVKA